MILKNNKKIVDVWRKLFENNLEITSWVNKINFKYY